MIRKEFIFAGLLTVAGVAGGYWLLPKSDDVAQMQVQDYNYDNPQAHYEQLFNSGDHSTEVVQQLVRIKTNTGEIDRAIEVLEIYVKEHPEDEKALQQLGDLYRYAQRYDDYMVILESRAKEKETVIVLQEMAELYNFFQEQQKQQETLARLYMLENGKNPETLRQLAMFAAVDKEYADVAKWLDELMALEPAAYVSEDAIRHVNALLELDRPEDALEVTQKWNRLEHADISTTGKLIDMLHYQGGSGYARQMLDSLPESTIRDNTELMQAWLLVLVAEGQQERAYRELAALEERNALPDALVPDYIYMAAIRGDMQRFEALRKSGGLERVSEVQLADIWINAQRLRQKSVTNAVRAQVKKSPADDYPLMNTLIAVYDRSPGRTKLLDNMLDQNLANETVLKLAQATANAGDRAYARKFLAKLPDASQLNDGELVSLEILYLSLSDMAGAKKLLVDLRASGRIGQYDIVGLRTAAATGDGARLRSWHSTKPEQVSNALTEELFYTAANHGQLDLAMELARWQKGSGQAEMRRTIASIYARKGRYEEALALLNSAPSNSASDLEMRVFLLSKLAAKSPQYQQALQALVKDRFNGSSRKLKEAMVYALLETGGDEAAMPYLRHMADQYGGEWWLSYADAAQKQGKMAEATEYRLKAARSNQFDAQTKLALAYALADGGESVAAQKILYELTKQPETRITAIEQMVYLWGVRPSDQQLTWLAAQWRAAEGEDKQRLAELMGGRIPQENIIPFVRSNPDLRQIAAVNDEYMQALVAQDRLGEEITTLAAVAQETGHTTSLVRLGALAHNNGKYPQARQAYDAALNVAPNNAEALVGATITADAQADYTAVDRYFNQYLAQVQQNPSAVPPRTHEAYFAYAEMLRREQKLDEARPYYAQSIELIKQLPTRDTRSLSIAAQSSAWIGKRPLSDKLFSHAFAQYPNDGVLHADRAALLIEHKEYDAAEMELEKVGHIATQYPQELQQPIVNAMDVGTNKRPELLDANRMVVYTAPESMAPRYWVDGVRRHSGVEYVTEGYNSVLVVTKVGYGMQVLGDEQSWAVEITPQKHFDSRSERAQLVLRRELLHARMELEQGELYDAATRIAVMEEQYGDDPQYRGFAANTYYYADNWPAAKREVAKAQALAPNNADIAKLARDIDRQHADRVRADVTMINRGDNTEIVTALSGEKQVSDQWRAGAVVRNHNLDVDARLQPDNTIRGQKGNRQTGELYGIYTHNATNYSTLRVFANNDTLGIGGDHVNVNKLGVTTASARWQEPYFTFVEAIYDDAVRDRLALSHKVKWAPWEFGGGISYNNYSISDADDVFSSFGIEGSVVYALRQAHPYIGLGYGLDAEYKIDDEQQRTITNVPYRRFPLRTREIHFASVTLAEDFGPRTFGSVLVGYGWDRFGGDGPSVEGQIQHNFYKQWDVGARAFYGLDTNSSDTAADLSLLNAYIQYRF